SDRARTLHGAAPASLPPWHEATPEGDRFHGHPVQRTRPPLPTHAVQEPHGSTRATVAGCRSGDARRPRASRRANGILATRYRTGALAAGPRLLQSWCASSGDVPFRKSYDRAACTLSWTSTSSPTSRPPVSSAAFQVRPKSLRFNRIAASKATFSLPHGSLATPR